MVIGLLIGSVGLVYSAIGKPGWDKRSNEFKLGYIVGSTDILRMLKRTTPEHQFSLAYTIPRGAKPVNWLFHVERLFAMPANKDRNITQILALAGADMEVEFGGDITVVSGLEQLGEALRRRREAISSGKIAPTPPEVIAQRQAAAAESKAKTKCMNECRHTCRDTCNEQIKAQFPDDDESAGEEPVEGPE
jgi:hypothetical protein